MSGVLLIGCGRMGAAMARGWLAAGLQSLWVVDPAPRPAAQPAAPSDGLDDPRIRWVADIADLPPDLVPDAVILAVKPQMMEQVAPRLAPFAAQGALVISIAAGRTLASLSAALGADARLVRAMPNLPAQIGRGISGAVAGPSVDAAGVALAERLLSACGDVVWVADESLIDAVTALSGCGPAYAFLLAEAMADAGVALGLPPELAARLARATLSGSGATLDAVPDAPSALRAAVTSPGGATAAALTALDAAEEGMRPLVLRGMRLAAARAAELAR